MQNEKETAIVIQPKTGAISAIESSLFTASNDSLVFPRNISSMVHLMSQCGKTSKQQKYMNVELNVLTEQIHQVRIVCFLVRQSS